MVAAILNGWASLTPAPVQARQTASKPRTQDEGKAGLMAVTLGAAALFVAVRMGLSWVVLAPH